MNKPYPRPLSDTQHRLPTLPHLLGRILEALYNPNLDLAGIAKIIRQDAALTARLIDVANTSHYLAHGNCLNLDRALLLLGLETVKTMAITAALKQFSDRLGRRHQGLLKEFWRRSLFSAQCALALARLSGFQRPDEAYLAGLMMDLGQLIFLIRFDKEYADLLVECNNDQDLLVAEQRRFGIDHCSLGAESIMGWKSASLLQDALRFHHYPIARLTDTHPLVKLVHLAGQLSAPGACADQAGEAAFQFFGLREETIADVRNKTGSDIARWAALLEIDIGESDYHIAEKKLWDRLSDINHVNQYSRELWRNQTLVGLEQSLQRASPLLLGLELVLLFSVDRNGEQLEARLPGDDMDKGHTRSADFIIPLIPGRSIVSESLLQGRVLIGKDEMGLLDRQILNLHGAEQLLLAPLFHKEKPMGVMVFGLHSQDTRPLAENDFLFNVLRQEIGAMLGRLGDRFETPAGTEDVEQIKERIRDSVHEASNPLSIIRNYLEILRQQLDSEHQAQNQFTLIKEEIDRVGNILLRLRNPVEPSFAEAKTDINKLVTELTGIFQKSLCLTREVTLSVGLVDAPLFTSVRAFPLKQILMNLIKNAIEAVPSGGEVRVGVGDVLFGGRNFCEISIMDNGPGIDPDVMKQLFSPIRSRKGKDHSGVGLHVAKKLTDELGGNLICRTGKQGTSFQLLFPHD